MYCNHCNCKLQPHVLQLQSLNCNCMYCNHCNCMYRMYCNRMVWVNMS